MGAIRFSTLSSLRLVQVHKSVHIHFDLTHTLSLHHRLVFEAPDLSLFCIDYLLFKMDLSLPFIQTQWWESLNIPLIA